MYNFLQISFTALTIIITAVHNDSNESAINDNPPPIHTDDMLIVELAEQAYPLDSMSHFETQASLTDQTLNPLSDKALLRLNTLKYARPCTLNPPLEQRQ